MSVIKNLGRVEILFSFVGLFGLSANFLIKLHL